MKKVLPPLVFLILNNYLYSQNWEIFPKDKIKYLSDSELPTGNFYSIRIDSTKESNAAIHLYNMKVKVDSSDNTKDCRWGDCEIFLAPGWLGPKIVKKSENLFQFNNELMDTLTLDFETNNVDKKIIFENDSIILEMQYIESDTSTILSFQDSIHIYELAHINKKTLDPLGLNKVKLKIGKNLGLITFFDIYKFPKESTPVQLLGMKNPDLGLFEITSAQFYNFEIDNIFEVKYSYSSSDVFGDPDYSKNYIWKYKILDKRTTSDLIVYEIFERKVGKITSKENPDSTFDYHQHNEIEVKNELLVTLPFDDPLEPKLYINEFIDSCGVKRLNFKIDFHDRWHYCKEFQCYGPKDCAGPCTKYSWSYITKLGLTTKKSSRSFGPDNGAFAKSESLMYYENNNTSCGVEILDPLNIKENEFSHSEILIGPNPFKTQTFVKLPISKSKYQVQIIDLSGKILRNYINVKGKNLTIKKGNLRSGVYFIKINNNKITQNNKIYILE